MHRCVYRAQVNRGAEECALAVIRGSTSCLTGFLQRGEIMTLSIYRWKQDIFTYYECIDKVIPPDELIKDLSTLLTKWPGLDEMQHWIPMMDIYHSCEPVSVDWWKRKQPVKRAYATLNRLRPEKVSSYVFYHYQYQEEKPGDWAKYASIYLHGNLMFFYREEPDGPVNPPYRGSLATNNTPEQWQDLMNSHFLPWEDDPEMKKPWKEMEQILYL